ncbi:MAG: NAD-dependent epimerase/dehydratase family protein [Promethearchaeota archaeon]
MPAVKPSDGPVAVTGASGYIGSHAVISLVKRGYTIHACITDPNNPDKTNHLLLLNSGDYPGKVKLFTANLLEAGLYDEPFKDCCAVLHIATRWGNPLQVYEGAVTGTKNVLDSVRKVGTVKRVVYTSTFSAIYHKEKSGYKFTENNWASENRENDPRWSLDQITETSDGDIAYSMAKVETEHQSYRTAKEDSNFDVITINPIGVLGPLLSKVHGTWGTWQWALGRMLAGEPCQRQWNALWNCVDVRDVAEAHVLAMESETVKNGDRFILGATDDSGIIDSLQLQAHLQKLFPNIRVGGPPDEIHGIIEKYGKIFQAPIAYCNKARELLGLKTHSVEDTLHETGQTMIDLGLVKPALK